ALSVSRTAIREPDGLRFGGVQLLHLGGSIRHLWLRQGRADRHRQLERRAVGFGGRKIRHSSRTVSFGFLRQMDGWAHRRSKGWLEGQRVVGDLRQPDAIPYRRRQGDKVQGPALPASSRSAGEVRGIVYNACLTPGAKQVKSFVGEVSFEWRGREIGRSLKLLDLMCRL